MASVRRARQEFSYWEILSHREADTWLENVIKQRSWHIFKHEVWMVRNSSHVKQHWVYFCRISHRTHRKIHCTKRCLHQLDLDKGKVRQSFFSSPRSGFRTLFLRFCSNIYFCALLRDYLQVESLNKLCAFFDNWQVHLYKAILTFCGWKLFWH